jgi:heme/copper-type cytochrome/quinol oxidase subunit 2
MADVILNILAILTLLVFIGVIYAVVYATFMFIFSGGNEEKIKKAWNSIRYALL